MGEGKLNYERERARKEAEAVIRSARRMKEDSEQMTGMAFLGCVLSPGKTPEDMIKLWHECRAAATEDCERDEEAS